MQYLPFFSATRDYENGEKISAGTPPPTKTFYDPLLRIIRIDTPKGFFSRVEFSPWVEKHYDENDTVLDSAFYNDFIKKGTSEQKFEEDTLKKARLFYNTPRQKVLDNTGKAFLTIETDVTADTAGNTQYIYLPTHSRLDIRGNLLAVTDPRLAKLAEPVQNLVQVFDLGNSILSSTSVDSGIKLTLNNIYGKPVHLWDGRGFHTAIKYDSLQRPVEVRVTGDDGRGLVLDQVVESIVYGESQPDNEDKNLRGQVYQHSDQAGEQYFYRYDIHAKAVETGRRLRRDYKSEVDWSGSPALEDEIFKTNFVYNALVMPISNTAPDGAVHNRQYNISGFLNKISAAFDDKPGQGPPAAHNFIDSIAYNANNQRLSVYRDTRTTTAGCGRGVLTQYTYESTTLRLLKIITTRYTDGGQGGMKAAVLQNIDYTYDPVGNVTRIYDNAFDTVFCSQQVVEPLCDYTYNALYKLTRATGRQHPGILAGTHWDGFKESLYLPLCPPPNPNDAEKLENYSEFYSYDDAGNLLQTRHMAASAAWTREAAAAPDSNRLISVEGKKVDYDAAGNMLNLGFMRDVQWNYRNNISRADIILRPDENPDSDFYVYGSDGNRIRKVSERYLGNGVTEIEEKIYLGDFELKRVSRKTEAGVSTIFKRQSTHVTDDRKRIATTHYWLQDDFKRETDTPGERKFRYQYDNNLGSAILETDEKANIISYEEYSPYGETVLIAGNSQKEVSLKEYRYSGKERDDSTGLYYYGARYYISWLGRWMSPDPAGAIDGLNLYAFVGGNPLAFIDDKGNVKILIVGEGRSFEYAIRLAQKLSVPATSASSASASSTSTAPTNTVIVTQYDVSAPPQSVAWLQNLQLYR
ncbi:MAG TPA: hypothetical protein DCZ10_01325, partial [Pelotomaculum sp.]|nr:hypothetical protein [Pelotomaculum sp.]